MNLVLIAGRGRVLSSPRENRLAMTSTRVFSQDARWKVGERSEIGGTNRRRANDLQESSDGWEGVENREGRRMTGQLLPLQFALRVLPAA